MVCHCAACGAELATPPEEDVSLVAVLARYFGVVLEAPVVSTEEHMPVRRRDAEPVAEGAPPPPVGWEGCEELWSFLADGRWEDGQRRELGSLTLFVDQGKLKAALNDRDASEVGFVTLDLDRPVQQQLDQALRSERIDWRRNGRKAR
jgi:hypothetical protein